MPQNPRFSWKLAVVGPALIGALLALVACATPAPYAPRGPGQATGYTDRQLAPNRFRITFTGNSVTPREQVEDNLLLRAAEVTLREGKAHFLFDRRDTMADVRTSVFPEPGFSRGPLWAGPWRPGYWRFRPRWGYDPFGPEFDIITTTRYQAFAEIVLLGSAAGEPRAVDARAVIDHLVPPAPPPRGP
jgi:hypothetical protein